MKYSSKTIEALEPQAKRYTVAVGDGLSIRVHPSGRKSWVARTYAYGKTRDVTLGHFPEMPLRSAQQKLRKARREAGLSLPTGYTLEDAFRIWCRLKKGNIVSYKDERRRLEKHILVHLRRMPLDEITAPLVIQTVKPLERKGNLATLKRVVMRLREIMDYAVCAGYIEYNPLSRLSRIFPSPKSTPMPSIEWQGLTGALEALREWPERKKLLFLWTLCNMLRPTEAAHSLKEWVDKDVLTIPAEHMKMDRPHRVPMDEFTNWILDRAAAASPHPRSRFIFPGRTSNKGISNQTLAKSLALTPLKGRLVAHGLRSIGRTWLADRMVAFDVAEAALAHLSGTAVTRAYMRSDYLEQRRPVMREWRRYVFSCAVRAGFIECFPCAAGLTHEERGHEDLCCHT